MEDDSLSIKGWTLKDTLGLKWPSSKMDVSA